MATKKKTTRKKAVKRPAKKKATRKKAAPKNKCAASLGRKGGLATKRKKVGIFSPAYKKKKKKKK